MSWTSTQHLRPVRKNHKKYGGYSFPLCVKIVETLEKSNMKFNIQTFHILRNNTRMDSEGNFYPICSGFLVSFELNVAFFGTFWSAFAGENRSFLSKKKKKKRKMKFRASKYCFRNIRKSSCLASFTLIIHVHLIFCFSVEILLAYYSYKQSPLSLTVTLLRIMYYIESFF